jgi:glycerol-3-phosphate acyltransferase PlsY
MTDFLVKVILSYLLGSVVGSLLVGRLRGGVDIRRLGSGNAGGTNALRTQGKGFAFWVMVIDIGKGWIATRWIPQLHVPGGALSLGWYGWVAVACGIAAIIGHVYPIWHGFRGGKGVATVIGAVLGLDPWMLVPMLVTWVVAVMLFGFVGLASMLGALALAVAAALGPAGPRQPLLVFGIVSALLIAFTHRSNIARMLAGTEPRAQRLWLFGSRRGGA